MVKKAKTRSAVLFLFLLAPICGELLSGSSPPQEFFEPFGFAIMTALYGSGAILIRELVRRWKKGWLAIFLLGLAYGIYEEGIIVRSFFDPGWHDLDLLAVYGRYLGVNWIWSLSLSLFHAVVSILIPILIVELCFPSIRKKTWVNLPGMLGFWLLFLSLIPVSIFFDTQANILQIALCCVAIVFLIGLAYLPWRIPSKIKTAFRPLPPWVAGGIGFLGMMGLFMVMWIFPALHLPWIINFLIGVILPLVILAICFISGAFGWDDRHGWAAAFGALFPWMILAILAEAQNAIRPDNTTGMTVVGLATAVSLILLGVLTNQRLRKSEKQHQLLLNKNQPYYNFQERHNHE